MVEMIFILSLFEVGLGFSAGKSGPTIGDLDGL